MKSIYARRGRTRRLKDDLTEARQSLTRNRNLTCLLMYYIKVLNARISDLERENTELKCHLSGVPR